MYKKFSPKDKKQFLAIFRKAVKKKNATMQCREKPKILP